MPPEPGWYVPKYRIGSVIKKGESSYTIIDDHVMPYRDTRFTIVKSDGRTVIPGFFGPKSLWIYGYRIMRNLSYEELVDLKLRMKGLLTKRTVRKARKSCNPEQCNEGNRYPLAQCEVVKGESPLKAGGSKPCLKGTRVVGLKVRCPLCSRKVSVIYRQRDGGYFTVKHKKKSLRRKEKKSRRTK